MRSRAKALVPFGILAASAVGGAILVLTAPSVESVAPERTLTVVRVTEAQPETVQLWVRSQGTVAPRTESTLVPEVSGPLVWVSPSLVSGGFFEQGDPLLRVDPRDYQAAVARARADVARAEGEWEHAKAELKRQQGLSDRNVVSSSQLDGARRAYRVAVAALDAARVSLDQAERDLTRTEIQAPFSGRVRDEQVDVGQFVSRGAPVASLYSTDFAEIRLPVADDQLAFLDLPVWGSGEQPQVGPEVRLYARFAGAEREWTGYIVRTEGEIDPRSRMVHVVARVEAPYGTGSAENDARTGFEPRAPLAVGLFVRAEIAGPAAENVLVVPRSAMRNDDRLLVVDAEDRLRLRSADVLRIDRDEVLLRVELAPGDRVCVSLLQVVVEGMQVRPVSADVAEAGS